MEVMIIGSDGRKIWTIPVYLSRKISAFVRNIIRWVLCVFRSRLSDFYRWALDNQI